MEILFELMFCIYTLENFNVKLWMVFSTLLYITVKSKDLFEINIKFINIPLPN